MTRNLRTLYIKYQGPRSNYKIRVIEVVEGWDAANQRLRDHQAFDTDTAPHHYSVRETGSRLKTLEGFNAPCLIGTDESKSPPIEMVSSQLLIEHMT